ncbi:TrkH family potassium uptake protein [Desulfosudis oleivorans]|uniref:Cation transporter n=1 Tax=Desulfosudis oleivorans (strain DSM 6200 / JCM 39069 / Hxd3) TaxID=96561 RepID=A8ZYR9_DESOH|nr:TrkH family potassium uptake protein [Desulfosudis oleivorans]ABW67174.1 cation transporter [Desulfosudis oleivorans Hxd3]
MRAQVILRYVGFVLLFNATFLLISALFSLAGGDSALSPLLFSTVVCALFGLFPLLFVPATTDISNREGLFIVVCSWLASCLVGTLPYLLWGGGFTFTNAWFESVSGFTTTGATILANVEGLAPGLLFWRAATHWMGGVGIIIFVLAVIPSMGAASMVLYRSEVSPLVKESFHYRTKKTLTILLYVYIGLTAAETLLLMIEGMSLFDAVTHAFSTIATGGFSTKNASIAHFASPGMETTIILFMVLSGVHFGLLYQAVTGNPKDLFQSTVFRYYMIAILVGVVLVTINIHGPVYGQWVDALRYAAFQVVSIGTSTGFANADSSVWPPFAQLAILFFTLQCACSGSTSGGIKADRIVLLWKAAARRLVRLRHPKSVVVVKVNQAAVDDEVVETALTYILIYLGVLLVSTLAITGFGVDIMTAFSGAAAAMGNVGPGFGTVGSMGNYSHLPDLVKWILTADMLVGRLEIFGLILFVTIHRWR